MSTLSSTLSSCLLVVLVMVPAGGLADARRPATQAASSDYLSAVQAAVDAYNERRLSDARANFERAHELKPSARTWHGLGLCSFELGHFEQAAVELQTALDDTRAPLVGEVRDEAIAMVRSAHQRRELAALEPAPSAAQPSEPAQGDETTVSSASSEAHGGNQDQHRGRTWWTAQNVAAVSVGAAGLAAVVVGAGFGVRSMREGNTRDEYCDQGMCTDIRGVRAAQSAIDAGRISTIGWAVGGALLVGAGIVWWTGRGARQESRSSAKLLLGPGSLKLHAAW